MTTLVDTAGRPLRASASTAPDRPHEGARSRGFFMKNWRSGGLRSADADWLYDRDEVVARARDVARNEGIGAAAGMRVINAAVGHRWDFTSKPNWKALGISYEDARELGSQIDALWEMYAYGIHFQPDAERTKTFGQLLRMSAAHIFHDGEMVGLVEYADDEPTRFKTRLRIVDPDRLSNPNGLPPKTRLENGNTVTAGVERNPAGVPVRYWIREGHPSDLGAVPNMTWSPWARYSTNLGRPQVIHAFDQLRAGQTRGITRFVTVLKHFRSLSKFTEKTIEAATLNAMFLGFVKSNAGPSSIKDGVVDMDELAAFASERDDFYDEHPVEVDGVRMPVLGLDDDVTMQTTARDTSGFGEFTRSMVRLIAAGLGVTYEEISMDFSQVNYSSARAALLVAWKETLALRGLIEQQIAWPFFAAWLEEAFDLGLIMPPAGAPDFYDAIDAYVEGAWRGPGRGHIDPTKEVAAAAARIETGISTLEKECAEYDGSDWEETLEQQAREAAKRSDLRLAPLAGASVSDSTPEEDRQRDQRPSGGALAGVRAMADAPEHNAFLDARPGV